MSATPPDSASGGSALYRRLETLDIALGGRVAYRAQR